MSDVRRAPNPKVFISHASEDKGRFVEKFARKLSDKGIKVWLDKWEMLPGDSLIDKIFEEGLKDADAIIIVLSNSSIEKPWVKEELNAAMVKRINSKTRIIPVILDNCSVPECLASTVYQPINNLQDYNKEFDQIVAGIFRITEKPDLGEQPGYVKSIINVIPGLTRADTFTFNILCQEAIKNGRYHGETSSLQEKVLQYDISPDQLRESLEILDSDYFIKLTRTVGGGIPLYQIIPYRLHEYCQSNIPEYEGMMRSVIAQIINHHNIDSRKIANATGLEPIFVEIILEALSNSNLLNLTKYIGGILISNISPRLKRMAETF